jgi:hypothetical protein
MNSVWSKCAILPAVLALVGATSATSLQAQSSAATPDPSIAERKENQQDRIANGVQSGQLTATETANLEGKEAAINAQTRADRKANGGALTAVEKAQINRQQNQASRDIYRKKHNAATQPGAK